jgi:hypothetical protein
MKAMTTTLIFAAALFCAAGASADDAMPNGAPNQSQPGTPATAPLQHDNTKKEAWESKVRQDCSAEIASGGVCEGKDFDSGLEKCLHKNRSKLSDSCKNATHPHMHGKKVRKEKGVINEDTGAKPAQSQSAPNSAPAEAPSNP